MAAKPLLVIGLDARASIEDTQRIRDQFAEAYPDIRVAVVAGCTSIGVVEGGDE